MVQFTWCKYSQNRNTHYITVSRSKSLATQIGNTFLKRLTIDIKWSAFSYFLLAKLNFFESLSKPALKGLTIAASTVAVVELLKQDYSVGISASLSWLLLLIVSNRLYKWKPFAFFMRLSYVYFLHLLIPMLKIMF